VGYRKPDICYEKFLIGSDRSDGAKRRLLEGLRQSLQQTSFVAQKPGDGDWRDTSF
jgi:hypothetical protein